MSDVLLAELSKAAGAETDDEFAEALLQAWTHVVQADFHSVIRHKAATGRVDFWCPGEGRLTHRHWLPRLYAKLLALEKEAIPHPNHAAFLKHGPGAYARSREMADAEWHRTANYRYVDKQRGICDMVCLYLPPSGGTLVTMHAGSRHSNFTDVALGRARKFHALAGVFVTARGGFDEKQPRPRPLLTEREQEVLRWVAEGKRNTEIACILDISKNTVRNHLENIFAKLGVETRTAAALSFWDTAQGSHGGAPAPFET